MPLAPPIDGGLGQWIIVRDAMAVSDQSGESVADETIDRWRVHWHDYLPAVFLVTIIVLAWFSRPATGMTGWGVSALALGQGRYQTILLHMFAHGSVFHLLTNSLALIEIGGLVTARLGGFGRGWLRALLAYGLAGLSSMIFYLSFHPQSNVPLIGASGAIYGLVGLLLGMRLIEELEFVSLGALPGALAHFIRNNLLFLALLVIGGALASLGGQVAWEAHLGGFLFGLCVGPWLLPLGIGRNRD